MKVQARIKCPCCGMQVSTNKLTTGDYFPLEGASFVNSRRGRKGGFKWIKNQPLEVEARLWLLLMLKEKLLRLLRKVELALLGYEQMEPSVLVTNVPSSSLMPRANSSSLLSQPSVELRQEESCLITSTKRPVRA
jgi:hypothetical protein